MSILLVDMESITIAAIIIGFINLIVFWIMAGNVGKIKDLLIDIHRDKLPHLYESTKDHNLKYPGAKSKDDSEIKEYIKKMDQEEN